MYLSTGVVWKKSTGTWKKFLVLVFSSTEDDHKDELYSKALTLSRFGIRRLTYDYVINYWVI